MSNNATRDASYITMKNAAKALNADYNAKLADVNSGKNTFMVTQSKHQTSAVFVTTRNLGCMFCAKAAAVTAKANGEPYNENLIDRSNAGPCSC